MRAYRVEELDGASHAVEAMAPFEAARKALGVEVTLRGDAAKWIRVVELTDKPPTRLRPGVFAFRVVGQFLPQHCLGSARRARLNDPHPPISRAVEPSLAGESSL
ncbi:hypothetical protein [Mesorhizobium sp. B2-4-6]|uniref:hypothetical protein n=1 Tax=Mesorhizobium sp. B2-4-6 TaxID=2589943 RepID=UPI00112949C4|nr:hypothetical protein [Mesorhizobium sp. B2-4-6]TPL40191.1 hypothetical protein FJ957_27200 [Mesorhizobium sp. B2-4-6]